MGKNSKQTVFPKRVACPTYGMLKINSSRSPIMSLKKIAPVHDLVVLSWLVFCWSCFQRLLAISSKHSEFHVIHHYLLSVWECVRLMGPFTFLPSHYWRVSRFVVIVVISNDRRFSSISIQNAPSGVCSSVEFQNKKFCVAFATLR